MIAALVVFGGEPPLPRLAVLLAWGSVAGSALQFLVQLPVVLRVAPDLRAGARPSAPEHVRTPCVARISCRSFISRGVVQISAYIDSLLASLLPTGAVAGLTNAQLLYTLPVSLFGMSVAAAELPAMSAIQPHRRGWSRSWRGGSPAAPSGRRPAADRVFRRAVGGGVSRARRRGRRRAASDRPIRSRGCACMCGRFSLARRSGCCRRRSAVCTRRPTTRCATRGRRCVCAGPRRARDRARLLLRDSAAALARHSALSGARPA